MIRPVLKYGTSELETESSPITGFDDEIRSLAQDMLETMYAAPGIGLAAPQVGVNLRLIVIDISGGEEQGRQLVLVNPDITEREGSQEGEEGCLSIPGLEEVVSRPECVTVTGFTPDGEPVEVEAEGLLARALQHEIDHLDGILFIDRVSPLKRRMLLKKWKKSQEED